MWAEDPIETALFVGLLAGLSWAPFWLGGFRPIPWGINSILFPGLVIAYEISLLVRGKAHPYGLRQLAIPAGLFLAVVVWIVLQMSSYAPVSLVHPVWTMASEVLGRPLDGAISVNPSQTALELTRLLTAACVAWLSIQLCRHPLRAYVLLRWVAATVAAYALYGIVLVAVYRGGIPFFDAPPSFVSVRSTFGNRNSFATYAGMGLVVCVALLLRMYRHEVPDAAGLRSYRLTRLIEATGSRGWLLLGMAFVIFVALLGSVSRGGILSTAVGVATLLIFTFTRKRKRRGEQFEALVFVLLAAAACFVVFGDLVAGRLATTGVVDTGRLAVYRIIVRAILDSPIIGFGYGTFADVFPLYRDQSIATYGVWDIAHNTYLEVWLGLGLIFGSMLIGALCYLAYQCINGAIKRRRDATPAMVGAACALLVGVHALVDFSVQIEAVTLTFMALLGAGVAESVSSRSLVAD